MSTLPEWQFPLGAPTDDPRLTYPVFSVLPNWKGGVTERLEWLTEVMPSEIAVEQRRSLRRFPRRSFEAGFLRTGNARTRLDMFLTGTGKKHCLVPMWHEQFTLKAPIAGHDGLVIFPTGTLGKREYAPNDMVMITTGDADRYAVLWIVATNAAIDHVQLWSPTNVGTWPQGSRIIPLRVARVMDAVTLDNRTDRVATTQMRFELSDADGRFPPSWGYCSPLWRVKPDRSDSMKVDFSRNDYTLDFSAGVVDVTDPGNRAQVITTAAMKLFGRDAVYAYRQFLYAARGRLHRFYMPTFTADIFPVTDLGGSQFDAEMNGFNEYMKEPQEARLIIAVDFKDGRPSVYRTIVSIDPVNQTVPPYRQVAERFTVDQPMPPILKREIERVSFVVPSRFDQDAFELKHYSDNSSAVATALVTRSVVVDGMPPIECWITSRPYPVVFEDALAPMMTVLDGSLGAHRIFPVETMTAAMTVEDGILREALRGYDSAPDAFSTAMSVHNGTFTSTGYRTYAAEPEAYTVSMIGASGTIRVALITYDWWLPEAIDVSMKVTNGTLS